MVNYALLEKLTVSYEQVVNDYLNELNDPEAFNTYTELKQCASLEGMLDSIGKFLDEAAQLINAVGISFNKLLMSGLPFFKAKMQKAQEIKDRAQKSTNTDLEAIDISGLKHLYINGRPPHREDLMNGFEMLNGISTQILSKEKLDQFKSISANVLEPFRSSIKTRKVDELVFIIGVLAILTNPAVPVGMVLKKLASAISPNAGKVIDVAAIATSLGISKYIVGGMAAVIATMGSTGAATVRDFFNGRVKLDAIPSYRSVYPFCDEELKEKTPLIVRNYTSPILLGDVYFLLTDYVDVVSDRLGGSATKPGVRFKKNKVEVSEVEHVKPITPSDVVILCDQIISMFARASQYSKAFPTFYRVYNEQFRAVGDIVASYDDPQLRGRYVRYSYRNAMNLLLDSMWKNCFGTDNKFIRHLLKVSDDTLKYCERVVDNVKAV